MKASMEFSFTSKITCSVLYDWEFNFSEGIYLLDKLYIDETFFFQGKGLFATLNFKAGDVIFEERPLVSCQFLWNAAYGYLACDFCLK